MALSKSSLSNRLYMKFISTWGPFGSVPQEGSEADNPDLAPDENLKKLADCIAEAVVDEIVQNATVQTTLGAPDSEHIGRVY